jgi:tetratricopeptide (TPR) repeat protein
VDARALRLLEFVVTHRAAGQKQGAGPWRESVLKALRDAGAGPWAPGEPAAMAEFLSACGALESEELRGEQVRILGSLLAQEPAGTPAHLRVAAALADVLWASDRREESLRETGGALEAARRSNGGRLPAWADGVLFRHADRLREAGEWMASEKVLLGELQAATSAGRARAFQEALFRLWAGALSADAATSLGRGEDLYREAQARMLAELEKRSNERHANEGVQALCTLWAAAARTRIEGVPGDVLGFSRDRVPAILDLYHHREASPLVSMVGSALLERCGPAQALGFLLDRAAQEPPWMRRANEDFWARHSHEAAEIRQRAKGLAEELESRLLAVVLRELREDMRTSVARNRCLYSRHNDFWEAKRDDFAKAALEVLAQNPGSERVAIHVAEYLYRDLERHGEAIDALAALAKEGKLSLAGRRQLCVYLRERERFAESIPILEGLIALRPDEPALRTDLMLAFLKTGDAGRVRKTLEEADRHFRAGERWTEPVIAQLGYGALMASLFAEAEAYYAEAVALHVRAAPNRGVGDGTLCEYYRNLAAARSGLGKTAEAVDAAAGAIVSWGRSIEERNSEISTLEEALRKAKDLDAYASKLAAEVDKTGLENPIVRKALGKVYVEREEFAKAETHLRAALQARPNDLETRELFVNALVGQQKAAEAVQELLEAARAAGHALQMFSRAGQMLQEAGNRAEAERAFTSLVEPSPLESEGHKALAEVRLAQGRAAEAVEEWRRVVEIRSNEPDGYLGLARALAELGKWDEAREAATKVLQGQWHRRFGDVRNQAEDILREIEEKKAR